jgi:hypothetical protein
MPRRLHFLVAGALLVCAAVAGCGASHRQTSPTTESQATNAALPTTSHLFTPYNLGEIATGVKVSKSDNGYCWEGSIADTRSDAWRCFLGNLILDPCFSNETGTSDFVICAEDPWSDVIKLTLTKNLPQSLANEETSDPTTSAPWAIELADGKQCVLLTGATGVIAGLRINYGCTGGGALVGEPHRQVATWTIFYGSSFGANTLGEKPIAQAWW